MDWDPTSDAWLSGFAAGEACFFIARVKGQPTAPRFHITLRADDWSVLEELKAAFGGGVHGMKADPRGGRPRAIWFVIAKRDLAKLVDYFDRFPLHAKKANDYPIWRRAVALYLSATVAERAEEMEALCDALREGRVYVQMESLAPVAELRAVEK